VVYIGYSNNISNGLRCVSFLLSLQLLLRTRTSRALQVDVACFLSPPEFSERHLLPCRCPELVLVNWKWRVLPRQAEDKRKTKQRVPSASHRDFAPQTPAPEQQNRGSSFDERFFPPAIYHLDLYHASLGKHAQERTN
jgi:hypothetical protein